MPITPNNQRQGLNQTAPTRPNQGKQRASSGDGYTQPINPADQRMQISSEAPAHAPKKKMSLAAKGMIAGGASTILGTGGIAGWFSIFS